MITPESEAEMLVATVEGVGWCSKPGKHPDAEPGACRRCVVDEVTDALRAAEKRGEERAAVDLRNQQAVCGCGDYINAATGGLCGNCEYPLRLMIKIRGEE